MAVEAKRGCGYRKIGGLYLVSGPGGMPCDRLPISLDVCPVCSHGFKQARGFTWTDVAGLVGGIHPNCQDEFPCPLCMATGDMGKAGLLWIGEKFYKTPEDFDRESAHLGVSRRIHALPRGFKVGETWILLAHPKTVPMVCTVCGGAGYADGVERGFILAGEESKTPSSAKEQCKDCNGTGRLKAPGIFKVWRPSRIEKIVAESSRGSAEVQELLDKGITPVFVPDNDPDHKGTVYDKEDDEIEVAA